MLNTDKYSDKKIVKQLAEKISSCTKGLKGKLCFMEVCGTHTHAFFRHGINSMLPENIKLISGPGCPVCVTPIRYMDKAIYYSSQKNYIIVTFGDLFRVPGTKSSLEKEKSKGADIRIIYSPLENIKIAESNRDKKIVFLGVGFETTAPTIAATLLEIEKKKLDNWFLLPGNKLIPPAMKTLVDSKYFRIDGFMCPGHVSAIIGSKPYGFISKQYAIPCVITGFEPLDILQGIYMLVNQHIHNRPEVQIQYSRIVRKEGNPKATRLMYKVFEICDSLWRGIGNIPQSGLKLNNKYSRFDIEKSSGIANLEPSKETKGCICGEILCGVKTPFDCKLFRKTCTPENPIGACMVSSEGTCSAYYKYGEGARKRGSKKVKS